jgi:DNA processing protein
VTAETPEQAAAPPQDDERAAACALAGLAGIGSQSLTIIREAYGSLTAAVSRGARAIAETPGLRSDGVESLREAADLAARGQWLLGKSREIGARILVLEDEDYPPLLKATSSPPPVLYLWGRLAEHRRVAVVGAREPDEYGVQRTKEVADLLCAAGIEVVSGGARGVDATAHEQALSRGGKTIAVIGSGLLFLYPRHRSGLFSKLANDGVVMTEFALDASANPTHFPQRNRTIAGMAEAVVITRGKSDSGALTTCQSAARLNRPVFAVPGQIGDPLAAAPNSLLSGGLARALVSGAEVITALGMPVPAAGSMPAAAKPPPLDLSRLPADVRQVFETLGPAPRHVDEIAEAAGLAPAAALAALLRLELDGLCTVRPGKYFQRR